MKNALLIGGGLVGAFLIYRAIIRKQAKNKPSMDVDGFSMNACGGSCGCRKCRGIELLTP
jgi:hypothetical protein